MHKHEEEVAHGERFEFGANWARFLKSLTPQRISQAERSLRTMLGVEHLAGLRFLDVGSGSGLFSLAARRLGASVHSFDYDPKSVGCTRELCRRYFPDDRAWRIDEASVLDTAYLARLGEFDVVYSWGVLHHTGHMWEALGNMVPLVKARGTLFIAIYNDQGGPSRRWHMIKRTYNRLPRLLRPLLFAGVYGPLELKALLGALVRGKPSRYFGNIINYSERRVRGMSYWHDLIDWIGGYPFEVAKPEEVFRFFRQRDFELRELATCAGGHGCNEYVFEKTVGRR